MNKLNDILNNANNIYKNRKSTANYIITNEKIADEINKVIKIQNRKNKIRKLKNIIR